MEKENIQITPTTVTWIIPVYNGEAYLAEAVSSILNQPCRDFHIIIVDDGSTDSTLTLARSFEGPQVTVLHKESKGVSSARNAGIRAAESPYLAFLDADDVLCKNAYDDSLHAILTAEQYDLLSFSFYVADQQLKFGQRVTAPDGEGTDAPSAIDHFKHCSSFLYHRRVFEGENAAAFPEGIRIREDVAFQFLANRKARSFRSMNRVLFVHRNNVCSVMHNLKGPDYLLQDTIPAWQWCKTRIPSETVRQECNILIFSEAVSYLKLACMDGIAPDSIRAAFDHPAVREALDNYGLLWRSCTAEYEAFQADPSRYWRRYRCRGILRCIARKAVHLPGLRRIYLRLRYRENIEDILHR